MNYVTDGFRWRHLLFYEKDTPMTKDELGFINLHMLHSKSAYIIYETSSGGYHVMGLTPLSTVSWAYGFKDLDMDLKGNCSGHVLRCNLKPHEKQTLLYAGYLQDFPVADQIYNMCKIKWKLQSKPTFQKWKSLFDIYRSDILIAQRAIASKRPIHKMTHSERRAQSRKDKERNKNAIH